MKTKNLRLGFPFVKTEYCHTLKSSKKCNFGWDKLFKRAEKKKKEKRKMQSKHAVFASKTKHDNNVNPFIMQ